MDGVLREPYSHGLERHVTVNVIMDRNEEAWATLGSTLMGLPEQGPVQDVRSSKVLEADLAAVSLAAPMPDTARRRQAARRTEAALCVSR